MKKQDLFHKMYFMLFNRITDAIRAIDSGKSDQAREILCKAQQDAEERYLEATE